MTALLKAFMTERLKLRRTLALWMTLIAPAVVAGLSFIILLRRSEPIAGGMDVWSALSGNTFMLWSMLMMPLFIALETVLTANIEHSGHCLKHLFALPVPRWAVYGAKLCVNILLNFLAILALILLLTIAGFGLLALRPDLQFSMAYPIGRLAVSGLILFLASLFIIAVHTWVSMRWRSVVVGLGLGIAATIIGVIVVNSDLWGYYPWAIPTILMTRFVGTGALDSIGEAINLAILPLSIILASAAAASVLGGWEIIRKDVL